MLVAHVMVTQPESHQEPAKLPEGAALHLLLPTPWMLLLAGLIAGDLTQGWGEPCFLGEELGSLCSSQKEHPLVQTNSFLVEEGRLPLFS